MEGWREGGIEGGRGRACLQLTGVLHAYEVELAGVLSCMEAL